MFPGELVPTPVGWVGSVGAGRVRGGQGAMHANTSTRPP